MSTLVLEHLKHTNASSNNITLAADGSLTLVGNATASGTLAVTGNLTVDTNTLFVDATNNKVAVGTNSPQTSASSASLQINKDGEALRIDGSAGTAREIFFRGTSTSNVASVHSDGSLKLRAEDAGTHMEFHTADTLAMNINSSGGICLDILIEPPAFSIFERADLEIKSVVIFNFSLTSPLPRIFNLLYFFPISLFSHNFFMFISS